jgi:orotate phosphoribosyltransferase-like protein
MFRRLELPRNVMRLSNKGLTKEQLAAEAEIRRKTAQKLYSSSESDDG